MRPVSHPLIPIVVIAMRSHRCLRYHKIILFPEARRVDPDQTDLWSSRSICAERGKSLIRGN